MPGSTSPAPFTALLFGLSGCLVDFGARTLPIAQQHSRLAQPPTRLDDEQLLPALLAAASECAEALPQADELLALLQRQHLPCSWLEELPAAVCAELGKVVPAWVRPMPLRGARPWPAPDTLWQALSELQVERLEGCVLIASEPRLLQAGLNAGLWCIGLATCGTLCGLALGDWQALEGKQREQLRASATLSLYRLGAHSVIDHLGELPACLEDLAARRQKGEKP
ncbi:MAG TPA: HAD family phosphatase [Pseudomonas sp.]|nr:HAD family phosphatase [Pseudomonas sp.]